MRARCRMLYHPLQNIDKVIVGIDVMERVGQHPASLMHQLTPRIWEQMFAANPLRSGSHDLAGLRTPADDRLRSVTSYFLASMKGEPILAGWQGERSRVFENEFGATSASVVILCVQQSQTGTNLCG